MTAQKCLYAFLDNPVKKVWQVLNVLVPGLGIPWGKKKKKDKIPVPNSYLGEEIIEINTACLSNKYWLSMWKVEDPMLESA